jgi:nitrite reductase (NADH) small subunit
MAAPAMIANTQSKIQNPKSKIPALCTEVCLGPVEAIPVGQGRAFQVGSRHIAVFRQRSGRLSALQNACPHRGGPLSEGIVGADTVICPFHAWKFHVETGECLTDPCELTRYAVREESGLVYLTVNA